MHSETYVLIRKKPNFSGLCSYFTITYSMICASALSQDFEPVTSLVSGSMRPERPPRRRAFLAMASRLKILESAPIRTHEIPDCFSFLSIILPFRICPATYTLKILVTALDRFEFSICGTFIVRMLPFLFGTCHANALSIESGLVHPPSREPWQQSQFFCV